GFRVLTLRGISDGYVPAGPPLVGMYIDDIPVGSTAGAIHGNVFGLDLMPYDIERVEVLQGPQGTLYGSNSMGGLIKYALRKPDLTQFEARAGTDLQTVDGGASPDWGVRGAVNLPIALNTLAFRLSAFDQTTAGWIDNVGTGIKDSNHSTQKGGRASLLWQATDALTLQATGLYQDTSADGWTNIDLDIHTQKPIYGWNKTNTNFPETFSQQTRLGALDINWNVGFATLTSVSSWSKLVSSFHEDFTDGLQAFVPYPGALILYAATDPLSKFVQEIRLTSPETQRLQWMLGGFYTRENGSEDSHWSSFTPTHVLLPDATYSIFVSGPGNAANVYKEKAVFANATYQLTNRFDVSAGERYSWYGQHNCG